MASLPPVGDVALAYSPDREVLDHLLVKAAVRAGAEVRENVSVQDLLTDETGVVGVRGRTKAGTAFEERARVVVGADGTHSRVARTVDAAVYNSRPTLSKSWWTYWSGLSLENEVITFRENGKHAFAWPTHDGLTIVGVAWVTDEFNALEGDTEAAFFGAIDEIAPEFAQRLRQGKREKRWICGSVPNFFRKPYGPGWALVGDASYSKDPGTAAGITDAMGGAELLADALDEGLSGARPMEEALAGYERVRNERAFPHYEYTCDFAALKRYSREELDVLSAIARSPKHAVGLVGVFADIITPAEFFFPENMYELFDYMGPTETLSWRTRFLRWLVTGAPGQFGWSRRVADQLMARSMGAMGEVLLNGGKRTWSGP